MGVPATLPALFEMTRAADESGVSGIGKVGEGAIWSDGTCTFRWLTAKARSTVFYGSFADFCAIHIDPHPDNGTELHWLEGKP